jgi:hypothetical protein
MIQQTYEEYEAEQRAIRRGEQPAPVEVDPEPVVEVAVKPKRARVRKQA